MSFFAPTFALFDVIRQAHRRQAQGYGVQAQHRTSAFAKATADRSNFTKAFS